MTTPQSLEALAGSLEAIQYEVEGLKFSTDQLRRQPDQNMRNVLLEAFAIHARALLGLLFNKNKPTDMFADDFVSDTGVWRRARGALPSVLHQVREHAGSEVAHLTYERSGVGLISTSWDIDAIEAGIDRMMRLFYAHIRPEIIAAARAPKRKPAEGIFTGTYQPTSPLLSFPLDPNFPLQEK